MRKLLLVFLTIQLVLQDFSFSQTSREAIKYFNEINNLWETSKFDTAIDYSIKLSKLAPRMFTDKIHSSLSQRILTDKLHSNSSKFLKLLYQTNNVNINQIITPIHTLNSIIETNDKDSVLILVRLFLSSLSDTCNYLSKAESYGLLIIKQMDNKTVYDNFLKEQLIQKIIQNIKANRNIDSTLLNNRYENEKRAWCRYVLSYSYYLLYQLNSDDIQAERNLKLAAKYSPDIYDRQFEYAYFYEAAMLTKNTKEIGFERYYIEYLIQNDRKDEALFIVTLKTVSEATNTNFSKLQTLYKELDYDKPFTQYWEDAINKTAKTTPNISVRFIDTVVDFAKQTGKWVYIDVWGTWCSPCIKELPELEKLYQDNLTNRETKLLIYTFSYNSTNLKDFLTTNKYSFPVVEIDDSVIAAFSVDGFPTKILITPQRKYLKIPFGVDWQQYLKNYSMIK